MNKDSGSGGQCPAKRNLPRAMVVDAQAQYWHSFERLTSVQEMPDARPQPSFHIAALRFGAQENIDPSLCEG